MPTRANRPRQGPYISASITWRFTRWDAAKPFVRPSPPPLPPPASRQQQHIIGANPRYISRCVCVSVRTQTGTGHPIARTRQKDMFQSWQSLTWRRLRPIEAEATPMGDSVHWHRASSLCRPACSSRVGVPCTPSPPCNVTAPAGGRGG